ncbi:MAG: hypothetical protein WBG36_12750 [Ornithinimicrobium sp.]
MTNQTQKGDACCRRTRVGDVQPTLLALHSKRPAEHASALLTDIVLASVKDTLSPTAQLTFRTHSHHPRFPKTIPAPRRGPGQDLPGGIPLRWVPTVIWAGTFTPWITPEDIKGRACTSLLLAHIGSMRPWRLIAIELGFPPVSPATRPRSSEG